MSQPATDPRERTILMMAIGTLFLIVVMAGVSVMTLLTILFPPPIPEGAVPDASGVDVTVPASTEPGQAEPGQDPSQAVESMPPMVPAVAPQGGEGDASGSEDRPAP